MPRYFPVDSKPFEIESLTQNWTTSHSIHRIVKHCVECTFLGGLPSYNIGFSPYNDKRQMVIYLRRNENQTHLYETLGPLHTQKWYAYKSFPPEIGETVLVCLDTTQTKIFSIRGEDRRETSYTYFHTATTWRVFFDASYLAVEEPTKVSINLGFKPFVNPLPDGFYPWIYNISTITGFKKKIFTFYCGQKVSHITICILFLKE